MEAAVVLTGSAVLCVAVVMVALAFDAQEIKRQNQRDKRRRPIVPDFTKAKR
jgi:hypothetical protein